MAQIDVFHCFLSKCTIDIHTCDAAKFTFGMICAAHSVSYTAEAAIPFSCVARNADLFAGVPPQIASTWKQKQFCQVKFKNLNNFTLMNCCIYFFCAYNLEVLRHYHARKGEAISFCFT